MEITLTYNIEINHPDIEDLLHEHVQRFIDTLSKMDTELLEITDTSIILYHHKIIDSHQNVDWDDPFICTDNELIASLNNIRYHQSIPYLKEPYVL
jgi:hypothetical protein